MKRLLLIYTLVFLSVSVFGQLRRPNRPWTSIDGSPGLILISELNVGYGLGGVSTPYSDRFFGFTSLAGYQVNEEFMIGGGTGLLFYNDGPIIPLFIDMRIRFTSSELTPYFSGSGGLLLNPSDFDSGTRMFINPSVGVRYSLSRNLAATLSGGLWMQMGSNIGRASLLNLKVGVVYKF